MQGFNGTTRTNQASLSLTNFYFKSLFLILFLYVITDF